MTDLEQLKQVWPLDWKESATGGWEVFFGRDRLYAYADGKWNFWISHAHDVDDTPLGRGDLRRAASRAAIYLRIWADEMSAQADDIGCAVVCAPGRGLR